VNGTPLPDGPWPLASAPAPTALVLAVVRALALAALRLDGRLAGEKALQPGKKAAGFLRDVGARFVVRRLAVRVRLAFAPGLLSLMALSLARLPAFGARLAPVEPLPAA